MSSSSFSLAAIGLATSSADSAPAQSRSTPSRSTSRPKSRNFASSSSSLSGSAEDRSGLPLRTSSSRTPSLSTFSWQIRSRVTHDMFTRSSGSVRPTYPRSELGGTVLVAIEEYLSMRETAEILADPAALRGLAEARESEQSGNVVYGAEAARALLAERKR